MKTIGPARKDRTFLVDMTYTLERDIRDDKGNIVYPAGYAFNPLSYVSYPRTLVILNGKRPEQIRWFEESPYAKDARSPFFSRTARTASSPSHSSVRYSTRAPS